MEIQTEERTKRKYTISPAVAKEHTFKRRLKALMHMRRQRAFIVTKASKAQARLERFDRKVKKATKALLSVM